jgi:hypothetical protein
VSPFETARAARSAFMRTLRATGAMGCGLIAYTHHAAGVPFAAWAGWAAFGLALLAAAVAPARARWGAR